MFISQLIILSVQLSSPRPEQDCLLSIPVEARASRLAELPDEIRAELSTISQGHLGDFESKVRTSHFEPRGMPGYSDGRFHAALLINKVWFVQFQVEMSTTVRTIGFQQVNKKSFVRSPMYNFDGPPCATMTAILAGVTASGHINS